MFLTAVKKLRIRPSEFWDITPLEFWIMCEGYIESRNEKISEMLYLAWHIEAFARQKKLPNLKKLLRESTKIKRPKKQLSTEHLMKIAKSKGLEVPTKWR